ncbi:MAG TPA: NifB/NifX family molybdenum-iron cluster-binding protein, partial [Spirochaetota bacterium]|nr:NifB/NifX family molybdenum-iron cluster-binding protein [Spirochaetota bacterium]
GAIIIERQLEARKKLKDKNIVVKINTIVIPTINENHILDVVKKVKELGADIINCIPIHPNKDTVFENITEPDKTVIQKVRVEVAAIMPQMHHCTRCRADAVGLIEDEMTLQNFKILEDVANMPLDPKDKRPYVAVASMEGILVNQHLGEAEEVYVYAYKDGKPFFIEKRPLPLAGGGNKRWIEFTEVIKDCSAVLVSGAGDNPRGIFFGQGVKVIITQGVIEELVGNYFKGIPLINYRKREGCSKGIECSGTGNGCG